MSSRSENLAQRVEQGAQDLIDAVQNLSEEQWQTLCGAEKRTVGVLVHHVGTMYPIEGDVVTTLAQTGELPGVDWAAVDGINAEHASTNADTSKAAAIELVRTNVGKAAAAVRALSDEQLDRVAPTALQWNAPLTVQFFIECHPIAHPYIHLESIKAALGNG